jgi:hypothetical protein
MQWIHNLDKWIYNTQYYTDIKMSKQAEHACNPRHKKLRQEDLKVEASLGYIASSILV